MKIEQRPIEGVLVVKSDNGHSVKVHQGHAHSTVMLKDGQAKVSLKTFKPAGLNVELIDESGTVIDTAVTLKLVAFETDPIVVKRGGQTYIDIQNNVSMKRLEALQVGFKSADALLSKSKTMKNMLTNSDLIHFPELNNFEGKGTLVIQALTRHGEKYLKTLKVQL